jgi:hypothetical protein
MAGFPEPQVGLVISYSYLWVEEAAQGRVEGRKDRPCAIVLALEGAHAEKGKFKRVAVAPITHTPPHDPNVAIEIPLRVKQHLGLDSERSWIILNEFNVFKWPGYDLRPIDEREGRVDYGLLPPKLFEQVIAKFAQLRRDGILAHTSRDDDPR